MLGKLQLQELEHLPRCDNRRTQQKQTTSGSLATSCMAAATMKALWCVPRRLHVTSSLASADTLNVVRSSLLAVL